MNIKELLLHGTTRLKAKNIENPRLEAEILLSHALQIKKTELILRDDEKPPENALKTFQKLLSKRESLEPIAYITGRKEFYGLAFSVDKSVLIPRPDTEILVEAVIEKYKRNDFIPKILDLCAGSGCIALSILKHINARATLADISNDALKIAQINAISLNLHDRVTFVSGDLFQNLPIKNKFDIIVSNPPYIPSSEIGNLQKDVSFEPKIALDGGKDGLNYYRKIIVNSKKYLTNNGSLFLEIGINQSEPVLNLMTKNNYRNIMIKKDLAGIERVVAGDV